MPWVVDVGSIAGGLSSMTIVSDTAAEVLIFWNSGIVLLTPTLIPRRSMVTSPKKKVTRYSPGVRSVMR